MPVIHKQVLYLMPMQHLRVSPSTHFLHVAEQHGNLTVWYEQTDDPMMDDPTVRVYVIPTGEHYGLPPEANYLGTVLLTAPALVFHVFVEGQVARG